MGQSAEKLIREAREAILSALGVRAREGELVFTSCGTEASALAILGSAHAKERRDAIRILTSDSEHPSVLNNILALEKEGFSVTYVGVDNCGVVKMDELRDAITEKTAIVAIMYANNEIGTIEPIEEICEIAHSKGALMFTDAVQAVGNVDIDLSKLKVDMLEE